MHVSDLQINPLDDACQLQARVESDREPGDAFWFAPFDLWYRFPAWCQSFLSMENGDPFLAALLLPAMSTGERLAIPTPVSSRLLEALPTIEAVLTAFYPRLDRIPVEIHPREESLPMGAGTSEPGSGLFFSLGVDSFYSLLKNQRDHPADDKTITHLIPVHGFDVPSSRWDERFPPAILDNAWRVASETGKTLIPVTTNVRHVGARLANWPMLHGAAMASIALALGPLLGRIHIAASTTYDRLYPWGTHPLLDPLWATETLTVVHDGCEMNTIDKTAFIARSPLALATLRPCASGGAEDTYNCGACLKCMRTMLDLLLAGALENCQTLPHEIDVERLRAVLRPGGPVHVADYQRRLQGLELLGIAPEVCQTLRKHLAQGLAAHWRTKLGPAAGDSTLRQS
jgi:hypothetical protein